MGSGNVGLTLTLRALGVGEAAAGVGALTAAFVALEAASIKTAFTFADFGKRVHDIEQETGLTARTVSTLSAAVDFLSNVSMQQVNTSIGLYLKNLSEAAHQNPAIAKTFQRFGIDASNALKDPNKAVIDLINYLAKIPNSAERLDAAFKLAGRGGKALADLAEQVRQMGGVFHLGRDVMPELKKAIDDISAALGADLLDWDRWGLAIGIQVARVRGAAEGFARWWAGNTWSPAQLGQDVEESADLAENSAVVDWVIRKRRADQGKNNERPPAPAFTGGIGDVPGKDKADKVREEAVRKIEQQLKGIEEAYRKHSEALQREYDLQVISSQTYTKKLIEEANVRYHKLKAALDQELLLQKPGSAAAEKTKNEIQRAQDERDKTIQQATDAQNKREIDALKAHRQAMLDLQDQYDGMAIEAIQTGAEGQATSYEDAENKIFNIQTKAFDRRLQALSDDEIAFYKASKDINDTNREVAQKYVDDIAALVAGQERAQREHDARVEEARQKDLQRQKAYYDKLFQLAKTYADNDRAQLQAAIDGALNSSLSQIRLKAIVTQWGLEVSDINEREKLANKKLDDEEAADVREFERQNKVIKGTKEYYDKLQAIHDNYEALRKQNQEQADADRRAAQKKAETQGAELSPTSGLSLFGKDYQDSINAGASKLQSFAAMFKGIFAELSASVGNFRSIFFNAFQSFGSALQQSIANWILYGGSIGQAMKQAAASVVAGIAVQAGIKALWELAEGFAALANPFTAWEAPMHFHAAALYGMVSGAALGVGLAMRGAIGNGGGDTAGAVASGGSSSSGTTSSSSPQPIVQGRPGGAPNPLEPQHVVTHTVIIEKQVVLTPPKDWVAKEISHPIDGEAARKAIERAVVNRWKNNGPLRNTVLKEIDYL